MQAINPATEQVISTHREHTPAQVDELLQQAGHAWKSWRQVPMEQRAAMIRVAGQILRRRLGELSRLMTCEMGKPIVQAEAEFEKCAGGWDLFPDRPASYCA